MTRQNNLRKTINIRKKSENETQCPLEKKSNKSLKKNIESNLMRRMSKRNSINLTMTLSDMNDKINDYINQLISNCDVNFSKAITLKNDCIEKQQEQFFEKLKMKNNENYGNSRNNSFIKRKNICHDYSNKKIYEKRNSLIKKTTKKKMIENSMDSYFYKINEMYSEKSKTAMQSLNQILNETFKKKIKHFLQYNEEISEFELMYLENIGIIKTFIQFLFRHYVRTFNKTINEFT